MGKQLSDSNKAEVLKDFVEWTGGFAPNEAQDQIEDYLDASVHPENHQLTREFLEAESEKD